jgi:hypothetical protein
MPIKSFKSFLSEATIPIPNDPGTMTFWHGGNLDDAFDETIAHKKGRWEYGPGLYLTTHYDTAMKYAKGGRKLYMITVKKGKQLEDEKLDFEVVKKFINQYVIKNKREELIERLEKRVKDGKLPAFMFCNNIVNTQAIKSSDTDKLRMFLVEQGIDYSIINNPFGWGDKMLVLFNMKNIIKKQVIGSKDKPEVYDLPTSFN